MSSTRDIKKRIKSIKNTAQITKAMEAVSATKMRRSQAFAIQARPYAVAGLEMLHNILKLTANLPPLMLKKAEVKKSALLVLTSDKGLAGAFNANVLRQAEQWLNKKKNSKADYFLITIGKKAKDYLGKRGFRVNKSFSGFGDYSSLEETEVVSKLVLEGFLKDDFDEIEALYTHFRTTLKQEVFLRKILPLDESGLKESVSGIIPEYGKYAELRKNADTKTLYNYEYKFEPSPTEILNSLVPQLLRIKIHHLILESNASEHSARMVAMKNASESAGDLIDNLNLVYNKARQANITRELSEITAGADALK